MNLFYLNDEEETPKKKIVRKKKNKNKKKIEENNHQDNELFSFDNEIVIGVTKKEEPKKQIEKNSKNKKAKKKNPPKEMQKAQVKKKKTKKNSSKNNSQIQKTIREQEKINKKKRKIAGIIKYGSIAILFIVVIACAMFSPLFNIKTIQVEGNKLITESEIITLSQIQVGENTFKLSKNKIIKQIKENAYINKVVVTRKLPSNIIITVEEREPAYLLEYASGYVYLDNQGYMLEISTEKLDLPVLQGASTETAEFIEGNRLCVEDLEKLSGLIKVMELAEINDLSELITRIDIENEQNIKLIFETKDKTAYLGDTTNLVNKMPMIKKILEDTEGKAGEIFVNMDLNNENPVFRERV